MPRLFDLELLNTLIVIAETGTISAAASQIGRSQSAVSEQMRKLEDLCGAVLFVRGKSGARLTPAGKKLADHGRRLLAMSDAAYRDIKGLQLSGELRLAITDYFRPRALPLILRRIKDEFPHLRLHVSILKSALVEHEVANGVYDIGISMHILDRDSGYEGVDQGGCLRREALYWVADKSFEWPENDALPLVVMPDSCALHQYIVKQLRKKNIRHEVIHTASGIAGVQLAVEAGLGVTCLNRSAIPETIQIYAGGLKLPALPDVAFMLTAAHGRETKMMTKVRSLLIEQMS